jgi:glycosyltransferase involved in cell wall biosynthesis
VLSFLLAAYVYLIYKILWRKEVSHVILDPWGFWGGFPFDVLSRIGLNKIKFIVDWRTFYFGGSGQDSRVLDTLVKLQTYVALKYSQCFHEGISVITATMKEAVMAWSGFDPRRICTWSSGANVDHFSPRPKDERLVEQLGLRGRFVIMYHGILSSSVDRGLEETVRAMQFVRQMCPQATLVLMGNGTIAEPLQKLANDLHLAESFLLIPAVTYQDVPRYVNLCDVGVMAYPDSDYWKYNNPIKLLEYLSLGKPVIVRDMITFRSVMGSHAGAVFIADNSPRTIANAIIKAQDNTEALRTEGLKGRAIVEQKYTWALQSMKLDCFLRGRSVSLGSENSASDTVPVQEGASVEKLS